VIRTKEMDSDSSHLIDDARGLNILHSPLESNTETHGTAGQGFRQAARDLGVFARSRCIETSCFKGSLLTALISGNPRSFLAYLARFGRRLRLDVDHGRSSFRATLLL